MKEIQEKSMLVWVSRRFELPRAWFVGSWLYINVEDFPNIAHITLLSMLVTGFSVLASGQWNSPAISRELAAYFSLETSPQFKFSIHVLSPNKKPKFNDACDLGSNTLIFAPECWKCILRGPDFKISPGGHVPRPPPPPQETRASSALKLHLWHKCCPSLPTPKHLPPTYNLIENLVLHLSITSP